FFRAVPGESRFIRMIPQHLVQNDAVEREAVNLQELKKQIQKSIEEKKEASIEDTVEEETLTEETAVSSEPPIILRQVSHKKYGMGKVLKEDEMMIEVEFENYGVKEFMKAFSELEFFSS
ncbi:MAG: ATP-dependent helicase, partial [Bacillota bacterium]|nr:ATP-dependent helicase [Bacillota bacterium]